VKTGFSLLEVLVAISIMAIVAGAAIPLAHGSVDRSRTAAAAHYMAGRIAMARFEAVKRSAFVAIRFVQTSGAYRFRAYVDGNANGVRSEDIASNIDRAIAGEEQLDHYFHGVAFGIQPDVTPIDPGPPLDPADPIQIGASPLLSFSPNGSCTSGTLFIRGQRASQFAVRVLGVTGRSRVFEYAFENERWRTH
jgi:prepilin-type N-terminal cleavage/methylation domain-containing protein